MDEILLPYRSEFVNEKPYGAPQLNVDVLLNVNENPYSPSKEMVEDLSEEVAKVAKNLNRYPDRDFIDLRKELSDYLYEESGVRVEAQQIWAANGSNEVMMQILNAFAGPKRNVLYFAPTYSMYPEDARNIYSNYIVGERTENFQIDIDKAKHLMVTHNPAVILLASPNKPTGTSLPIEDI